jgi:hypothetical protein
MRGGSKLSMRQTAPQMPLNIERVGDGRMDRNEALSRFVYAAEQYQASERRRSAAALLDPLSQVGASGQRLRTTSFPPKRTEPSAHRHADVARSRRRDVNLTCQMSV